jgi:hypothetical protein
MIGAQSPSPIHLSVAETRVTRRNELVQRTKVAVYADLSPREYRPVQLTLSMVADRRSARKPESKELGAARRNSPIRPNGLVVEDCGPTQAMPLRMKQEMEDIGHCRGSLMVKREM